MEVCTNNLCRFSRKVRFGITYVSRRQFPQGIKPQLCSTVIIMEPESVARAMWITIMLDDNKATGGAKTGGGTNPHRGSNNGPTRQSYSSPATTSTIRSYKKYTTSFGNQFKRLTEAEFVKKKAKGICFWCDEKFTPGNRCPAKPFKCW